MIETKLPGCIYRGHVVSEDAEFGCFCEKRELKPATLQICLDCEFRIANHFDVDAMQIETVVVTSEPDHTPEQSPLPSLGEQLVNGVKGIVKAVLRYDPADPATVKKRWTICQGGTLEDGTVVPKCEFNLFWECRKCGCLVSLKIRDSKQSCPLSPPKWGPVDVAH